MNLLLLLTIISWGICQAQPNGTDASQNLTSAPNTSAPTPVPSTPAPLVEGSSPFKWLGIAINITVIVGLLGMSCWLARGSLTRPGGDLCTSLTMLIPPRSLAELKRLFSSDLRVVVPTASEASVIASSRVDGRLRSLPASLLCWRRSQLTTAMVFYFVVLCLSTANILTGDSFAVEVAEVEFQSDNTVLRKHFKNQMLDIIPFSQAVLALSFYSFAAYRWHDLNQSRFLTVAGFCVTFLLPFVFFMVPWMEIDSPQRMVQDMCRGLANAVPIVSIITGVNLKDTNICDKKAHEIGDAFTKQLQLNVVNGDFALTLMGQVLKLLVYVPTLISSFIVMKSLAPGVLGILMGLQGGLRVSKITFPGARLTTWLLVMLQAAALPVTMFLCAIILIVVGTYPTMFTAIFMTLSGSLYICFSGRLLKAIRVDEAIVLMSKLNKAALVMKIIALGCLLLGVWQASHIIALKSQGIKAIKNALKPQSISRMVVSFMAGFFSSKVVFTDIVLHMIIGTYVACVGDSQEDRNSVMRDLIFLSSALKEYEHVFDLDDIENRMDFREMGQLTSAAPLEGMVELKVIANDGAFSNSSPMLRRDSQGFMRGPNINASINASVRDGDSPLGTQSGSMYVYKL